MASTDYRKKARNARRWSIALFIGAGIFAGLGIFLFVSTGSLINLVTISSSAIIVVSGLGLRNSAASFDRLADRLRP